MRHMQANVSLRAISAWSGINEFFMSAAKKDQFEKIDRNIHNVCWLVFFTSNTMASLDMRGCTCVLFYIVITLYTQSTAESRILRGFQDAKMKNRVFLSPPIHVSSKRSKIQCVDACSMVQACISLLYNSVNKSCFLYDQDFTEDDNWDSEENWDYFYIIRGKYGAFVTKKWWLKNGVRLPLGRKHKELQKIFLILKYHSG